MEQKIYKIQYTYTGDILEPEMQVTIGPVTLIEAVSYVRTIALVFRKTVEIVSVQASQDDEEWADVPDWAEQEQAYKKENDAG